MGIRPWKQFVQHYVVGTADYAHFGTTTKFYKPWRTVEKQFTISVFSTHVGTHNNVSLTKLTNWGGALFQTKIGAKLWKIKIKKIALAMPFIVCRLNYLLLNMLRFKLTALQGLYIHRQCICALAPRPLAEFHMGARWFCMWQLGGEVSAKMGGHAQQKECLWDPPHGVTNWW